MPTLILVGSETKRAATINAFAATPPSFSAALPHLATAHWDLPLTRALLVVGAIGAYITALCFSGRAIASTVDQALGLDAALDGPALFQQVLGDMVEHRQVVGRSTPSARA